MKVSRLHPLRRVDYSLPDVSSIRIKVVETNGWYWNRLREFTIDKDSESDFFFECPMTKCFGNSSGISYFDCLYEMVQKKEKFRRTRLGCQGYGGYNLSFHCDWYVVLEIEITYLSL